MQKWTFNFIIAAGESMFLRNFISSREGPVKTRETKQGWNMQNTTLLWNDSGKKDKKNTLRQLHIQQV